MFRRRVSLHLSLFLPPLSTLLSLAYPQSYPLKSNLSLGDGRYILSNGKDQSCRLWDLRSMASSSVCDNVPDAADRFGTNYDYRNGVYPKPRYQKAPGDCSVMVSCERTKERRRRREEKSNRADFPVLFRFSLCFHRHTAGTRSSERSSGATSLPRTRQDSSTSTLDPLMVEYTFVVLSLSLSSRLLSTLLSLPLTVLLTSSCPVGLEPRRPHRSSSRPTLLCSSRRHLSRGSLLRPFSSRFVFASSSTNHWRRRRSF